ncbi:glucosamine-6-phosphate isomerase 2-like protein [Aphelenchoides avenae]|nr:glucosamine-6-phosphate isomerase 2-like protein [Aphelenchus avenae]
MKLIILDDYDQASEFAAKYVCKRILDFAPTADKMFTLGLPTGSTPLGMYKKLIEYYNRGVLSFKYVKTFNMDEYVGLPRNHPESYHSFMFQNFFRHIDIDPKNAHLLDGNAPNLNAECQRFEAEIKAAGGIELFIGGKLLTMTLAQETIQANARFFGNDLNLVPKQALTVGVGTIMDAREVLIMISGVHKAYALHKAIEDGVSHMWTVSAFQMHPNAMFVADEDATLELKVKTVKYFKGLMGTHSQLVDDFDRKTTP